MARRTQAADPGIVEKPVGTDQPDREVEARMGQYLAAFGSGAGAARIPRRTIDILRYRYLPCIRGMVAKHPAAWEAEGPQVADLMRGVGRLAADTALRRGEITIRPYDAWVACEQVEAATRVLEPVATGNHPAVSPALPTWGTLPKTRPAKRTRR